MLSISSFPGMMHKKLLGILWSASSLPGAERRAPLFDTELLFNCWSGMVQEGSCRTEQDLAKYTVGNRPISSHLMNSQLATVAKVNSSVPVPNFDTRVETKQPAPA
eukprot:COSAG02_NODE_3679_length_6390_cov_3.572405_1_plen_106_part_00